MTRTPDYMGIKPEAWRAWLALTDALHALEDAGTPPVCQQQPDLWSSDATPAERRDAAEACGFCPARHACAAFGIANRETGVWGGLDLTPTPTRKAAAA